MLNIQILQSSFNMCKFFTSSLPFSVFPLGNFSFLFFPKWNFYWNITTLWPDPPTPPPYLIQSPDASGFIDFSVLFQSFLYFKHVERIWHHDLGHKATQHIFDQEDAWTFKVHCTVHGNFFFTLKIEFTGKKILKSCGIVISNICF